MSPTGTLPTAFLLFLLTGAAAAENNKLIIAFGGDPGSPVPHSYDYGAPKDNEPFYRLRIPAIKPKMKTVFYDTELVVSSADKIVQSVSAYRAYRALTHCEAAREVVVEKLADALPREYAGSETWQYQSVDGKVVGRIICEQRRVDPMPVLALRIEIAN